MLSVSESVTAFNAHIRPIGAGGRRARGRSKRSTGSQSPPGPCGRESCHACCPVDLARAPFVWDALALETTLPVLRHCLHAVKAMRRRLERRVPLDAAGDSRRLAHSLECFPGRQRRIGFDIHARAVRALLRVRRPAHPSCKPEGAAGGAPCALAHLVLCSIRGPGKFMMGLSMDAHSGGPRIRCRGTPSTCSAVEHTLRGQLLITYLVNPASSHMLVSKIKLCMS